VTRGFRSKNSGRGSGFRVIIYKPAQDYLAALERLDRNDAIGCVDALATLGGDPFKHRLRTEIARWSGPEFDYWLRKGRHSFGYRVDKKKKIVHIIDAWFK
jgi:hypothetical protein